MDSKFGLFLILFCFTYESIHAHSKKVLNIGHRGDSGLFPEHTLESYRSAIDHGADFIECDVVLTADLTPVCLHETLLNDTTDVANRAQFRDRVRTHTIDGSEITGWFSVDFTLAELRELKVVQRHDFRYQGFNSQFNISTLEEHIILAQEHGVGIYPEIKEPEFINSLDIMPNGMRFEDIVVDMLTSYNYTSRDSPCYIQSFSEDSLVYIRDELESDLSLIMLFWVDKTEEDLDRYVQQQFDGVGCWKEQIARFYTDNEGYKNWISEETDFVSQCKDRGLIVHVYTFRNEDQYLAWDFDQDHYKEYEYFLSYDIDGIFTDFPASFTRYLESIEEVYPTDTADRNMVCMSAFIVGLIWNIMVKP